MLFSDLRNMRRNSESADMEVIVRPTKSDSSWLAARLIAAAIRARPQIVLGLATGRTMERLYARLVQIHREEGLDFSLVRTFNLDEYIGLPPEDANSYRYYMNHHLFDHINIDKRNTFLPDGMTNDENEEGERYEAAIQEAGGIDLQLLGIGRAGHIGFNEPLSALHSRTRAKALTPLTIAENSGNSTIQNACLVVLSPWGLGPFLRRNACWSW